MWEFVLFAVVVAPVNNLAYAKIYIIHAHNDYKLQLRPISMFFNLYYSVLDFLTFF